MAEKKLTEEKALEAKSELLQVQSELLSRMREYDSERVFRTARLKLIAWLGLFSFVVVVGSAVISVVGGREILLGVTENLVSEVLTDTLEDRLAELEEELAEFDRIREAEGYLTSGGVDTYLSRVLYNIDSFSDICVGGPGEPPEVATVRLHFDAAFTANQRSFDYNNLNNRIGPFHLPGGTRGIKDVNCWVHEGFWDISSPRTPYFRNSADMPRVEAISFEFINLVDTAGVRTPQTDEENFRARWNAVKAIRIWLGANGRSGLIMFNPGKLEDNDDLFLEEKINLIDRLEFRERTDRIGRVLLDAVFVLKEPIALVDIIEG